MTSRSDPPPGSLAMWFDARRRVSVAPDGRVTSWKSVVSEHRLLSAEPVYFTHIFGMKTSHLAIMFVGTKDKGGA